MACKKTFLCKKTNTQKKKTLTVIIHIKVEVRKRCRDLSDLCQDVSWVEVVTLSANTKLKLINSFLNTYYTNFSNCKIYK